MRTKTILSTSLSFSFTLAAYVMYIVAVAGQNKNWIVISALVYFLPLFVEFADDLYNVTLKKKWHLILIICCFVLAVLYISFLLSYISLFEENMTEVIFTICKIFIIALPSVCIPLKAYPFFSSLMQWYNRCMGSQHHNSR